MFDPKSFVLGVIATFTSCAIACSIWGRVSPDSLQKSLDVYKK